MNGPIGREPLTFDDAGHRAIDGMGPQIRKVNWFSTYHVDHRVTDHFRRGRETQKFSIGRPLADPEQSVAALDRYFDTRGIALKASARRMRCRSRRGRSRRVRRRSSDAAMAVFVEKSFVRTMLTTLTEVGKRAGAVKSATESVGVSGVLNAAMLRSARV